MRVNQDNKSVDMEARDINYILPAYVRSYLFYSKNEMPRKIVYPMFPSVTVQGKEIPIEYVPPLDAVAVEIAKDGGDVAEVTPEQELVLDEKDDRIKELKEEVLTPAPEDLIRQQEEAAALNGPDYGTDPPIEKQEEMSPAKAAFAEAEDKVESGERPSEPSENKGIKGGRPLQPDRQPKQPPGGDIGPGSALSDMQARDRKDQIRTARDLVDEPDINEAEEKEYEKPITRDEEGKPVVEDNPLDDVK